MRWPYMPYTLPLLLIASLSAALAIFAWKRRSARDAVVERMGDGVIVLDARDRIVDVNLVVQRIVGIAASDMLGRPFEHALSDRPRLIQCYRNAVAELGQGVSEFSHEQAPDEEEGRRHYELRVSPLQSKRGRFIGRLVTLRDTTDHKQAEEALHNQKQLFEGLVAVARATAERPTLEATLQNALIVAAALTGAEYGTLFLLDDQGAVTNSLLIRGRESLEQHQGVIARIVDEGLAGWVVHHGQPVLIPDTRADERWLRLPGASPAVRSALAVPIMSGSALLGVLTLTHSEPEHFDAEHTRLMQAAADQMALALRNAQIFEAQRRMADRQTTLYQVLRAVAGQLDPDDVAYAAVRSITQFAGWPNVTIALPDQDETHWTAHTVEDELIPLGRKRFLIDQGIIGRAFRTGQTQLVHDVSADPDYVAGYSSARSELAVPLRHGERTLGVLDVESDLSAAFDTRDVLLAESLADAIALAMENASLYAETRQRVSDLDTLYTVTRMTGQSLALEDVLLRALTSVLLSLGFEAGLISLADPVDGSLYLSAEHRLPSVLSRRWQERGLEGTLCAYVHKQRVSLVIEDLRDEISEPLNRVATEMASFGLRAFAGIPLLHREQSLGTIGLFAHRPRTFLVAEIALLEAIGRQVATAVANARLFQATVNGRQRLLTLIESSRDGIIFVGMNGQTLVINAPAVELLHLPGEPSDWTDRPIQDVLDIMEQSAPSVARMLLEEISRIKVGDEPPGEGECNLFSHAVHWLNLPVLAGTIPLGRLLVLRDVTEERSIDRMREDLTHTMVHDLRNPLTSISAALLLLDSKLAHVLTPGQHRLLEIANESTQRMVDLVSAILDVSQLESGQMPLNRTPVSLTGLSAEAMDLQSPLAAARELRLESQVPAALPLAWADAELIGRVLQNLIGNAIKFTPTGGLVKITARRGDEERGTEPGQYSPYLCVSVADSGPGITPGLQDKLFQKFVVGEQEGRGSGLGLAFCKLAVEMHGGRIWVDSSPGKGATFSFTLPIASADGMVQPSADR